MTNEFWFEATGARIFGVDSGVGAPIILLHGGLSNHQGIRAWSTALEERFRVITPDLRASGRSHDPSPLSWDQLADDVAGLARHLGITRAIVGGVSFGSGCAVRVALRYPELVEKLVVIHPAYGGADLGLLPAQVAAMQAMHAVGARAVREGIAVMFPLFEALPAAIRERARAVVATYDPASVAALTAFMASGAQPFEDVDELARIAAPIVLVPGVDPTHPPEVSARYRALATVISTSDFAAACVVR